MRVATTFVICGWLFARDPPRVETAGTFTNAGNVMLDTLAFAMWSAMNNRRAINQTGLTGVHEMLIDCEPDNSAPGEPNLQRALEDTLGLRLEYRMVPISVFTAAHVAPAPTEN
jgi:uncharacterized protein (TIGR03435 family)